jgi:hypothetical protein
MGGDRPLQLLILRAQLLDLLYEVMDAGTSAGF